MDVCHEVCIIKAVSVQVLWALHGVQHGAWFVRVT